MSRHLHREVETLKQNLLMIGTAVEEAIDRAFRALLDGDADLAASVIADDKKIDEWEIEIEESGLKLLALYRPVGDDLRFIISVLKMNAELERMGDLAANMAGMHNLLASTPEVSLPDHFKEMVKLVREMVRRTIRAMIDRDEKLALEVTNGDSLVDELHRRTFVLVEKAVKADPTAVRGLLCVTSLSRHLERIADHATNIAEDVVYMLTGKIIRHHVEEYFKRSDG